MTGSIFRLPIQEEGSSTLQPNVSSSRAPQTIAPPVVSPPPSRHVWSQRLGLCTPGERGKAAEEHPSE
jgi:hypothetical protein